MLGFRTGIERNDTTFRAAFPYAQTPWSGTKAQTTVTSAARSFRPGPEALGSGRRPNYPNPFEEMTTLQYEVAQRTALTHFRE